MRLEAKLGRELFTRYRSDIRKAKQSFRLSKRNSLYPKDFQRFAMVKSVRKFIIALAFLLVFAAGFIFRDLVPAPASVFQDNSVNPSPSFPPKKSFTVIKVVDGDTIRTDTNELVRYLGIDAPEKNGPLGISAGRYNEGLVLDKKITLEFDYETHDQYGRLLGYVWLDDLMVNEKLVEEGYAKVYTIPKTKKLKYWDRLIKAETWAKEHHNGMWLKEWID